MSSRCTSSYPIHQKGGQAAESWLIMTMMYMVNVYFVFCFCFLLDLCFPKCIHRCTKTCTSHSSIISCWRTHRCSHGEYSCHVSFCQNHLPVAASKDITLFIQAVPCHISCGLQTGSSNGNHMDTMGLCCAFVQNSGWDSNRSNKRKRKPIHHRQSSWEWSG